MAVFEIEIKETLLRKVYVVAEDYEMAYQQVAAQYKEEEIVLGPEDYTETTIAPSMADPRYADLMNDPDFMEFTLQAAKEMIANLSVEELVDLAFGDVEIGLRRFGLI